MTSGSMYSFCNLLKAKWFFILPLLLLIGCVKDKPNPPHYKTPAANGRVVLIANEGAFGSGNASLSVYNIDSNILYNDVYYHENNQHLGDVLQSIYVIKDYIFLAINNSDRITVVDRKNYKVIKNIAINKPRYMLQVSDDKMYVTSLFHPEINIIDLNTLSLSGKITTDFNNTEGLFMQDDKVYVCNWDTSCNYIYEINPAEDIITNRITIAGYAPQQIVSDRYKKLWVIAGNVTYGKRASITQLDPENHQLLHEFIFDNDADIMKPVMNPTQDTLYYLGVSYNGGTEFNGVFRMSINDQQVPTAAFINAQSLQYFWGLGIDSFTGNIYIGDPKGFVQSGTVSIFNPQGQLLNTFSTLVGPSFFVFQ